MRARRIVTTPGSKRIAALLTALSSVAVVPAPAAGDEIAGAIVETLDAPCDRPAGIGYDSGNLWIVCDEAPTPTIYKWDPDTETVLDSFPARAAEYAFGLDHDGSRLWGDTDVPEVIYSADEDDGSVLSFFASPFGEDSDPNGVVWDGSALWHSAFFEDLVRVSTAGAVLDTIPSPGGTVPRDMAWVEGELWVVDANSNTEDGIYRLDPADGRVIGYFQPTGATLSLIYGLAYDGTSFWTTDINRSEVHRLSVNFKIFSDGFVGGDVCEWSFSQGAGGC